MEIIAGLDQVKQGRPSVITVGNFDGVHLGHRQLLHKVMNLAKERKLLGTLVTFDRHPRAVVSSSPASKVRILTNLDEKILFVEKQSIDRLIIVKFTREFSELSYQQFVENILIGKLGMKAMVLGHDHAFGRDRAGNIDNLEILVKKYGFDIFEVSAYKINALTVSSSQIREHLTGGRVDEAAELLGRNYSFSGIVVRGEGRGRKLLFPTANISPENQSKLIPAEGVYAVDCNLKSGKFRGMANIGYKPTFGSADKTIEIHLFNFSENIYGEKISVEFLKRIRNEIKFNSEKELIAQLNKDKKRSSEV
jgi:riboflavin kinase/FMN adenylyltransferase